MRKKVIRDGRVAVLVSYGHGAGWYSWNDDERLLFDPKLIALVENGRRLEITESWVLENLGIANVFCSGVKGLDIVWMEEGTGFEIDEYDGAESLRHNGCGIVC